MSEIDVSGTSLQGYVSITYAKLVKVFGEPNALGDGYKKQAKWNFVTPDGDAVTIYDYKQGACYHGKGKGIKVEDVTDWHIGGHNPVVVFWVKSQLDELGE